MRPERVHVHVERLVLDGLELGAGDAPRIAAALDRELARLLTAAGRAPDGLRSDATLARLRTPDAALPAGAAPETIGAHLAGAVHAGIAGGGPRPAAAHPSGGRR
jgi:hypothetical protein